MDPWIILTLLGLLSLGLGIVKYQSVYGSLPEKERDWIWQRKFAEVWNCFINFMLPGLVGYYFIRLRWPLLEGGASPGWADFTLLMVFALGLFGHLNVLSYNITKGVEAILNRILAR